jgi:hypothetical protein
MNLLAMNKLFRDRGRGYSRVHQYFLWLCHYAWRCPLSNALLFAGIIAGVVGGIVVGLQVDLH